MSLRLTRSMRVLAGRMIVLAYLFCVVSPGVALAFGDGPEPCLDDVVAPVVAMHEIAHHEMMAQMQADAGRDHHEGMHLDGMQSDVMHIDGMHMHHLMHDAAVPSHHDHGKAPGACCAALCVVGIAVDLPTLAAPTQFAAGRVYSGDQSLVGRAPPLLYRPPIALV
jgi:hypothetical protein